jgi:hypothetical protein
MYDPSSNAGGEGESVMRNAMSELFYL